ncbi:MAG: carboxypeptidase-like regulatory domain-containing protein [Bryobacter sp.]|nr:carboxypeptidase-like regulatory domain-containing protein [Bryobacter sp.]
MMLRAIGYILLVFAVAMGAQASPCGWLSTPCKVLNQGSIFFVGKIVKEEPYEGPKVASEEWGPLRKFTLQIDEPLYGLRDEKEIVAIASGFPYGASEGLFWLKRRDYGVVVSEAPSSCMVIDPKFFKNLLSYLREAKRRGREGATVRGALRFKEKDLANIEVRAIREDNFERKVRTKKDGVFEFRDLPPGSYKLAFGSQEYRVRREPNPWRVEALSCPDSYWGVEVEEILSTLSGRVLGLPHPLISNVKVKLLPANRRSPDKVEASTSFYWNSQFSLRPVPPGEYLLRVEANSLRHPEIRILPHASEVKQVTVARADLDDMELLLYERRIKRVVFQFQDEAGQPLAGQQFSWRQCGERGSDTSYITANTNKEGLVETDLYELAEYSLCWGGASLEEINPRPVVAGDERVIVCMRPRPR